MLKLETQTSLALHSMPLTRMVYPVVSALEQISLSPVQSCHPSTLPLQSDDMITDKEQPAPHPLEVSMCSDGCCVCVCVLKPAVDPFN